MTVSGAQAQTLQLVARIVDSWTPALVEAVDGSRKHMLARAVAREIGVERLLRLDEPDFDQVVRSNDAVVLVEGDARATELSIDRRLASALHDRLSEQPFVIVARRLGSATTEHRTAAQLLHLTERDLWHDAAVIEAELNVDTATAVMVHELTSGWPVLLEGAAERLRHGTSNDLHTELTSSIDLRLRSTLEQLPPNHVALLHQLSPFEAFDDEVALRLDADGMLDDLVHAGVPLLEAGLGWYRFPTVVRGWLRNQTDPFRAPMPTKLLEYLAEAGRPFEAIECALDYGQHIDAAQLLAGLSVDQSVSVDPARLDAAIARLAGHGDVHPRINLVRARAEMLRGSVHLAAQLLSESAATAATPDLAEELKAETAFYHYFAGELDEAAALVVGEDKRFTLGAAEARRVEVEAGLLALESTNDSLQRAAELFDRAAQLWREADQPIAAGGIATHLGLEVEFKRGHMATAIELFEQSEDAVRTSPTSLTSRRLLRAMALAFIGDRDATLDVLLRCRAVIESSGISLFEAYEQIALMTLASQDGEVEVVRRAEATIREIMDPDDATRALLLGDLLDAYVRCDAADDARRLLAELQEHPAAEPAATQLASATVACVFDDAAAGRRLAEELTANEVVIPRGDWRALIAAAVACVRLGDVDAAQVLLRQANEDAGQRGTPGVIQRAESWAITKITEPQGAAAPAPRARCHVQLFDKFALSIDGSPLAVPRGRPRTLLKLLILSEGSASVDTVTDTLWPGDDPSLGRQRLRNILTRLRTRYGNVIERDGPLLRLRPGAVSSDYSTWIEAARNAQTSSSAVLDGLIGTAPIELSAEDRFDQWFQPFDRRYRIDLLRLIDKRIETAIADGDTPAALAMYHRALDIEPEASYRIDSATSLALSAGLPDDAATFESRRIA